MSVVQATMQELQAATTSRLKSSDLEAEVTRQMWLLDSDDFVSSVMGFPVNHEAASYLQ
eukprot:m.10777 g.10777  ORF g.10777 m.10777 type:complete len:59 (+) comp9679_c0_seq1:64-240(+)